MSENYSFFTCYISARYLYLLSLYALVLSGCASPAYFKTANDVHKINGSVYMEDGSVKKGQLTISLEMKESGYKEISIIPAGSAKPENLNFKDIKYYAIDSDIYVPKIIDLYLNKDYHYLFVKRITKAEDKLQFYELRQGYESNDAGEARSYYYFSLPYFSRYEVVDINSVKVVPGFDFKMSDYVADCPELAGKIKNKQQGYFYAFLALQADKLQVMKKIVKEYNECNQAAH